MSKLTCYWIVIISLVFGITDRTINGIVNDYSIESLSQILLAGTLLVLVNQLYPYNH